MAANLATRLIFLSFMVFKASAVMVSLCRATISEIASFIQTECIRASSNSLMRLENNFWFMGSRMLIMSRCISMVSLSVMNSTLRLVRSVMTLLKSAPEELDLTGMCLVN